MLASTWFDPVLGLDIHTVLMPPVGIPTPIPMPFMGMVFDPLGMAIGLGINCALGGSAGLVLVNGLPATNCGTGVTNLMTCPHLPAPGPFAMGLPDNDAELLFGALDVTFAGASPVRFGEVAFSCSDPVRMPTSIVLAIPKGMPVLVMRPPAPDMMGVAFAAGRAGFRQLRRFQHASDWFRNLSAKLRVQNPGRWGQRWNKFVCFLTGHPVDVATGRLLTDAIDFELPGPLPVVFERNYDSSASARVGALGHGWSHSLEEAAWLERGCVVVRREDGREVEVSTTHLPGRVIRPGDRIDDALEGFELRCVSPFHFELETRDGVIRELAPIAGDRPGQSRLIARRTRDGHRVELSYDARGRLEKLRDSRGRTVLFDHDSRGRLTSIKLPTAHDRGWITHRTFEYDAAGDLVKVTDSQRHAWRFEYVSHLLVQETDRAGVSFFFQYDGHGPSAKCVRTWGQSAPDESGNVTNGLYDHVIHYDSRNKRTIVENSLGEPTVYEMDEAGQVVAVMDAMGGKTRYGYDDHGHCTIEIDPLGHTTTRVFDARGDLVVHVAPDGATSRLERDTRGHLRRFVDPVGAETRFVHDDAGRLLARVLPDGSRDEYEWREGLLTAAIDPAGRRTQLLYGSSKMVNALRLPNGGVVAYRYDERGRRTRVDDARGGRVEMRYDTEDRVVEVMSPTGLLRTMAYDAEGNVVRVEDATRSIRFAYGHYHRCVLREEAGATLRFGYDTEDRLLRVENEAGEAYVFELDAAGRVRAETTFDGGRTVYLRDLAGRATQRIAPSARTTKLTYDAASRPTEVHHSDGSFVRFEYDARGGLVRAESEGADVRLERDVLGRIVRESQDGGATWVSSRFGLDGARALVESTLGARQRVETDALGLVAALHHGASDGFPVRTERDELGDETRRSYPGGIAVEWQRDLAGRPTQRRTLRHRTGHGARSSEGAGAGSAGRDDVQELDALVYQWRGDDQIAALLDAERGPRVFEHDRRGRLVRERRPDRVVERAMDAVGNVYRRADGQDRRYGRGGLLEAANDERGAVTFTHDADGNQTTKHEPDGTHWTYRWNGHGFLSEVERRSDVTDAACASRVEPDLRVRFTYDAFARRVAKRLEVDGDVRETRFVWDGHTVLHELRSVLPDEATRDPLGLRRASLDPLALAPATLQAHDERELTTWYWDPGTFTPIAKERAGRRWSIASDHLGTPTEMYDELGELAWRMQLDVFGVPTFEEGTAEDCPWRWPGQYDDVETGQFYNRWRYYDPESGRYTSLDPIRLLGGVGLFGYVAAPDSTVDFIGLTEAFPLDPRDFSKLVGHPGVESVTQDGTTRFRWQLSSTLRVRYESHPEGLTPDDPAWNARHHGPHYHVEVRIDPTKSWNASGNVGKIKPPGYTPGSGTAFVPGESFPGSDCKS